jgi:hypothetical protein
VLSLLRPGHHRAQLGSHPLDLVIAIFPPKLLEPMPPCLVFRQPLAGE